VKVALRQEDLGGGIEAVVYRFPTERIEVREQRRRIAARRRRLVVRRRRLALAGVTILMSCGLLLATGPSGTATASRDDAPKAVVMRAGDSLWSLAERYAPEGIDPRAYVDAVMTTNGFEAPPEAGQRVRLP
jgi:hypothetical protein